VVDSIRVVSCMIGKARETVPSGWGSPAPKPWGARARRAPPRPRNGCYAVGATGAPTFGGLFENCGVGSTRLSVPLTARIAKPMPERSVEPAALG
jgi:hypothetical protein